MTAMRPTVWPTLLLVLLLQLSFAAVHAQAPPRKKATETKDTTAIRTRILFVLDASGSMQARWQNNTRWQVATRLLSEIMDSLMLTPQVEVALRVYGHQTFRDQGDCKDTRLEVPFTEGGHRQIQDKLKSIKPMGNTPIAYSLSQAGMDFPDDPLSRNVVILITDGLENCSGDPCLVSYQLQKSNVFLKPFVIGLGLDLSMREAFDCVGTYYDAQQESAFKQALTAVVAQALNTTTLQIDLLDSNGNASETNIPMSLYAREAQMDRYHYVHTKNNKGYSDTVAIDPSSSYDLTVHTTPPLFKKGIVIEAGKHNTVQVLNCEQGSLELVVAGVSGYKGLRAIVRNPADGALVATQDFNTIRKYLAGTYDLEIPSTPVIVVRAIRLKPGSPERIQIPQPGMVNIACNTGGYGAIYSLNGATPVKCYDLSPTLSMETVVLQPGNYRVVFRSASSTRMVFSLVKDFSIRSGEINTVRF